MRKIILGMTLFNSVYTSFFNGEDIDIPLSKSEQSLSRDEEEGKEMPFTRYESYSAHPIWYTESLHNHG